MARILILFSTTDGHTLEICRRLRQVVEALGHRATLTAIDAWRSEDLGRYDKIVVGARIRYGRHSRQVYDFVADARPALESRPSAFFSVNVVARKPGKDTPETNPYLRKFLRRIAWQPRHLAVFAGEIDYRKYGWLDRQVIRLIMRITKGPTEPGTVTDFTDWTRVEAFGRQIAAME